MSDNKIAAYIRGLAAKISNLESQIKGQESFDIEDELKKIPGRRVFHTLIALQTFTTAQDGQRGAAMTFSVSQDGPFVMTHYPLVQWYPSLPTNGDRFGRFRTVSSFPSMMGMPVQPTVAAANLNFDTIDIAYEMSDDGSSRNLQNELAVPAGLLSSPGNLLPLTKQTYFRPNSVIAFTPTYLSIDFDTGGTDTTQGTLVVALPGYKIINLG